MAPRCAHRLLAATLVLGCGCSFVAVRRAPPPTSEPAPGAVLECTQSRVAPALDTAGAIAAPLLGLSIWGACVFAQSMQSWSSNPQNLSCGAFLWGTLLTTAAYTGSAVYGYHATGECRRLAAGLPQTAPSTAPPLPANLAPSPPR